MPSHSLRNMNQHVHNYVYVCACTLLGDSSEVLLKWKLELKLDESLSQQWNDPYGPPQEVF